LEQPASFRVLDVAVPRFITGKLDFIKALQHNFGPLN
jgi:hypothetical protein